MSGHTVIGHHASIARAFLAALLFAAVGCRGQGTAPEEPVVAQVRGTDIGAEEFRTQYIDYLLRTGVQDSPSLRNTFLEGLIDQRLLVLEARAEGVEESEAYQQKAETVRRKLYLDRFAATVLFDTIQVRDTERKEMFVRMNTSLKARHLYARTLPEAERLHGRLQSGTSFETLAAEVFADTALANSGGSVGYFDYDEMDPAFEDAAYGLAVGEVSPPVRTTYGYSIIQLQDRFVKPLLTETDYAEKLDRIDRYVRYRKQQAARKAYARVLSESLSFTFDEAGLERLMGQISGDAPTLDDLEDWLDAPLVTFSLEGQTRTWTLAAFREAARFTDDRQRAQIQTLSDLQSFTRGLVVRDVMLEDARSAGLGRSGAFEEAFEKEMNDWVYNMVRQRLRSEISVEEDSVRAYYEANSAEIMVPQKVRVREIMTETRAEAVQIREALANAPFDALARLYSIRPGADETSGDLGFLSRQELRELADPVYQAAEETVLGPLELAGRYVLLQVGSRQAARVATLEEARPQIRQQLLLFANKNRLADAARALRAQSDVRVRDDILHAIVLIPNTKS